MKAFLEKWYVLFMMMRIARHNKIREKFKKKYAEVFEDYGDDLAYMEFKKCYEKDGKLYKENKKTGSTYVVAEKPQRDDFGLYEYVEQHRGWCEDDFYGVIYTKTPFKNLWLEHGFSC